MTAPARWHIITDQADAIAYATPETIQPTLDRYATLTGAHVVGAYQVSED